jgi:hypothetical protein
MEEKATKTNEQRMKEKIKKEVEINSPEKDGRK